MRSTTRDLNIPHHPLNHSLRSQRLYNCRHSPARHPHFSDISIYIRYHSSAPSQSQSLKTCAIQPCAVGILVHLEQRTSRHHTCSSLYLAASHSESFTRWRVEDDTHYYNHKEGSS